MKNSAVTTTQGTRTLAALTGVGVPIGPKWRALMETVEPTVRLLELVIPSKLVLGDPVDNCTVTGVVSPKNVGSDWILKVFGGATLATLPVTRGHRRKRKSVVAVAKVKPEPAVNAVMRTATVCPGARAEVSVRPVKGSAEGT